ncbi:Aromatic amino acid aminotransferase C56E4.03 [Grifola frondosa]|uniref:Aromatic amino acid aminotransferase C56E4.03 n=1 Tax=Grifola frondosa TaxID=5627 RepID=A0A1C7LQ13_GRIFR|nr:Aromatic amino acid aminotransferase C56E4.03 [Grifola frondosa]
MKEIFRLIQRKPNLISLANGDPHFSLYPIRKVVFDVASVAEIDPVASWKAATPTTQSQELISSGDSSCVLPIKTVLGYGHGSGCTEAQQAVTTLTNFYHSPPNHVVTLTLGNSDGISKCFRLLGDPGDHFLADEFSFTSFKIDGGGLVPEELEKILTEWKSGRRRKPHVLYTVPCGQNPTGSNLSIERRKRIYNIAQRFDLIIVEDDPYYFLQYGSAQSQETCHTAPFMASFLSMDTDGRVMRLDSFSKIIAPGMRLGWLTTNPTFHAHLISYIDSSTQFPHAFGQMFIAEILGVHGWQLEGFDRWVRSMRAEYQRRRDLFMNIFTRTVGNTGWASASPPDAGMFVWIRVNVELHSRYRRVCTGKIMDGPQSCTRTNVPQLMQELFERCMDNGLIIMPASIFALKALPEYDGANDRIEDRSNFLRATFAGAEESMEAGLTILADVLDGFFAA